MPNPYPGLWVFLASGEEAVTILLQLINYCSDNVQAPGEAEAELAWLNNMGKIDGIITNDGDALVFGAQCILRK